MSEIEELISKLTQELDAAKQRVLALQIDASERNRRLREKYQQFIKSSERIRELLKPRIETFGSFFKNVDQSVSQLLRGPGGTEIHGTIVTFRFPHTDQCPATVTLKFGLGHDQSIEHLILTYNVDIIPVFMEFKKHDELVLPVDQVDETAVVEWFDRNAVEFAKTFLNMYFHPEYQKEGLVSDVVLGLSFPRLFAAGHKVHDGRNFYFFSKESLEEFERDPARYAPPLTPA